MGLKLGRKGNSEKRSGGGLFRKRAAEAPTSNAAAQEELSSRAPLANQTWFSSAVESQDASGASELGPVSNELIAPDLANGCGPASSDMARWFGNRLFKPQIPICNIHDTGTEDRVGWLNGTKDEANDVFKQGLQDNCDQLFDEGSLRHARCDASAEFLYWMVDNYGDEAYEDAERVAIEHGFKYGPAAPTDEEMAAWEEEAKVQAGCVEEPGFFEKLREKPIDTALLYAANSFFPAGTANAPAAQACVDPGPSEAALTAQNVISAAPMAGPAAKYLAPAWKTVKPVASALPKAVKAIGATRLPAKAAGWAKKQIDSAIVKTPLKGVTGLFDGRRRGQD